MQGQHETWSATNLYAILNLYHFHQQIKHGLVLLPDHYMSSCVYIHATSFIEHPRTAARSRLGDQRRKRRMREIERAARCMHLILKTRPSGHAYLGSQTDTCVINQTDPTIMSWVMWTPKCHYVLKVLLSLLNARLTGTHFEQLTLITILLVFTGRHIRKCLSYNIYLYCYFHTHKLIK